MEKGDKFWERSTLCPEIVLEESTNISQDQVWNHPTLQTAEQVEAEIIKVWRSTYGLDKVDPTYFGSFITELNKHFNIIFDPFVLLTNPGLNIMAGHVLAEISKKIDWSKLPTPEFVANQRIYVSDGRWYVEERVQHIFPRFAEDGTFVKWTYTTFPDENGKTYTVDKTEATATAGEALKRIIKATWGWYVATARERYNYVRNNYVRK